MAIHNGANIYSKNLMVHLNASNPASYPGTGNTWYDLSGNGNHFTLDGATFVDGTTPTRYPVKYFNFSDNAGASAYLSPTNVFDSVDGNSALNGHNSVVEMDIRLNADQANTVLFSYMGSDDVEQYSLLLEGSTLYFRGDGYNVTLPNYIKTGYAFEPSAIGSFVTLTFIRLAGFIYLYYINNTYITVNATGTSLPGLSSGGSIVLGQKQTSVLGGYDNTYDFPGDIAAFRLYSLKYPEDFNGTAWWGIGRAARSFKDRYAGI